MSCGALEMNFVLFYSRLLISYSWLGPFHFSRERKSEVGPLPRSSKTQALRHPKTLVPDLFLGLLEHLQEASLPYKPFETVTVAGVSGCPLSNAFI